MLALADLGHWQVVGVRELCTIDEAHVEALGHVDCQNLEVGFCEGFSEANTTSAQKGAVGHRLALLAIRSQRARIFAVEALWPELLRLLPFLAVVVEPIDVHLKSVASFDQVLADRRVLGQTCA